jgi:Mg2+/Co2+ transporter CorB
VEQLPLWAQIGAVFLLLICSSFFSISETAMMAINRHRLKHLANKNALGAKTTQGLLAHTDQLLSVVLIGNNLFNTIIPVLTTSIALHTFGRNNVVLSIATGIVAFLIIVFAEITPKIVGATFPEKIAGQPADRTDDAHRQAARLVRQSVRKHDLARPAYQH